jgi:hypothetical protein
MLQRVDLALAHRHRQTAAQAQTGFRGRRTLPARLVQRKLRQIQQPLLIE